MVLNGRFYSERSVGNSSYVGVGYGLVWNLIHSLHLLRRIINKCSEFDRFHTKPHPTRMQSQLPKDRPEQSLSFTTIRVD